LRRIRSLYAVDYDCFGYRGGLEAKEAGLDPAESPKVESFRYNWHNCNRFWMKFRSVVDIEKHCDTCA